jgi:GNAT superfamily N-acetyltransferase
MTKAVTDRPVIRPIERADFPAAIDMLQKLAEHVSPGTVPRITTEDLGRYGPAGLGLFSALIATRDSLPVGLCLYTYAFSGWRGRPGLFVQDLYVEPSERGSGLGKALLLAALRREAPNDCAFLKLDVDKANAGAIGFYQRLGFSLEDHDHTMVIEAVEFAGSNDVD